MSFNNGEHLWYSLLDVFLRVQTRKCRKDLQQAVFLPILEVRIGVQEIRIGSVAAEEQVGLPDRIVVGFEAGTVLEHGPYWCYARARCD